MLLIRQKQMDAFKQGALRTFENSMLTHCFEFAERHCDAIGQERLRQVIRLGIERASDYGLTLRGPVRFYIEMMFMFGSSFDSDPQYPWVSAILKDENLPDQMQRADALYDKEMEYFTTVFGPNGEYALAALRAIPGFAKSPLAITTENFASRMLAQLKQLYPEKCNYIGDECLQNVIQEATEMAETHQFLNPRSLALFVVLMFAFGHGFMDDPLFPWIAHTLNDPKLSAPEDKSRRLEERMLVYLDEVLKHAG